MPFFRYEAVDSAGKTVNGTMNAPSESEVSVRLTQMGYSASAVMPTPTNGVAAVGASQRAVTLQTSPPRTSNTPESKLGGASAKEMALFFRQFAALVRSGITLFQALEHLGPRTAQPALRQTANEMSNAARNGSRISDVMEKYP